MEPDYGTEDYNMPPLMTAANIIKATYDKLKENLHIPGDPKKLQVVDHA